MPGPSQVYRGPLGLSIELLWGSEPPRFQCLALWSVLVDEELVAMLAPRAAAVRVAPGAQAQTLAPGGGPGGPKIDSFLGLGGVSGPRRGAGPI